MKIIYKNKILYLYSMNVLLNLPAHQIKNLYNSLSLYKVKGKIEMVLEPLQSMIHIALLSATPIGTKITIHENIIELQIPSIIQPFNRWFHSDKKDDLYFLFQVIKRFLKWYNPEVNSKSPINLELYNNIIKMSIIGLENLVKTYMSTDNNSIIEVIQMYKKLLTDAINVNDNEANELENIVDKKSIDDIFINIIEIYDEYIINVIGNTLILIKNEEDNIMVDNYINGLGLLMSKTNKKIKDWISKNLII
jgi:hypothetical protein